MDIMTMSERLHQASLRSPNWTDEANRRLHVAIATKIREQPRMLGIAVENLRMWKRRHDHSLQPMLRRWKLILMTWNLEDILDYLADPSEEAVKMRRTSPFCGVLTDNEQKLAMLAEGAR